MRIAIASENKWHDSGGDRGRGRFISADRDLTLMASHLYCSLTISTKHKCHRFLCDWYVDEDPQGPFTSDKWCYVTDQTMPFQTSMQVP